MNQNLLRQVADFKKKNFSNLIQANVKKRVLKKKETRKRPLPSQLVSKNKKGVRKSRKVDENSDLKLKKARSRLSLLAAVVEHLKNNYINKNGGYMTLEEVLTATDNADAQFADKTWLLEVAFPTNNRIKMDGNRIMYAPPYELTDKYSLFKLLGHYDENGLGGVYLDDIRESIPNFDHVVRVIRHHYCHVTRKDNDKDVLFLYEPEYVVDIDEDILKSWKKVSTAGLEDVDIINELKKDGIAALATISTPKKKTGTGDGVKKPRQRKAGKKVNVHLTEDYFEIQPKKLP
ncbi:General transcription factor IIE subunit 2 [Thelohanellus kitauei]|uniref:Transcription initiation factor IIE subunit beta n=1 Tax=Thelohanellus kitauei TaxID=669202 RepID=A0A0C2J546_THEKT|nr:General transcription factor IIE subunit 2 [Thelohanellus kitauei]